MKTLYHCDRIAQLLISEGINCDALVVSEELMEYLALYRCEILSTFTDNMIQLISEYLIREAIIRTTPSVIKTDKIDMDSLCKTLSIVNAVSSITSGIHQFHNYREECKILNRVDNLSYLKFLNGKGSFIYLNKDLVNEEFYDTIQVASECLDSIEGLYVSREIDKQFVVAKDHIDGVYRIMSPNKIRMSSI